MGSRNNTPLDLADDNGGSTEPRRGFWRRHRIVLIAFVSLVSILCVSVLGFAYALNHSLSNIKKVPITINNSARPTPENTKALNVLLLGADAGTARHPKGQNKSILDDAASSHWPVGKYRSDATMLVHISADRKEVYVVSVPRDSYVKIYDSAGEPRQDTKINAALSIYGPSGAISTLENFTNLRIDHLAMVDWDGFEAITNALGGVRINIPRSYTDTKQGNKTWTKGEQVLKGKDALLYVRERYNLPHGDFDRVKRQQNFLRAIMTKLVDRGTLTNPIKLKKTLDSFTKNMAVDDDWSASGMRSLAFSMRHIHPGNVTFMTIPTKGTASDPIAGSIVVVDKAKCQELFASIKADDVGGYLAKHPDTTLQDPNSVS